MTIKITKAHTQEFLHTIEPLFPYIHFYKESFVQRRVEYVISHIKPSSWEDFLIYIQQEKNIDNFLYHFLVPTTEFFRDSEFWNKLYHSILPKITEEKPCNIWLPDSTSGEELFSLCILLHMLNLQESCNITLSCSSQKRISEIKSGVFNIQSETLLLSNFKESNIPKDINKYYEVTYNSLQFSKKLISNVNFKHASSALIQYPDSTDLVLYRNKFLYIKESKQRKLITHIYNTVSFGGYVVLGLKESNSIPGINSLLKLEHNKERIYKKK